VHTVAVGHEAKAVGERVQRVTEGVRGPAEMPAQASRAGTGQYDTAVPAFPQISGRPCARQTAIRFTTLPPSTRMTSWATRCARTSGTFGWMKSRRTLRSTSGRDANAAALPSIWACASPTAVGT
jgi:hypothetical protein